jgi:hypothetical protein
MSRQKDWAASRAPGTHPRPRRIGLTRLDGEKWAVRRCGRRRQLRLFNQDKGLDEAANPENAKDSVRYPCGDPREPVLRR